MSLSTGEQAPEECLCRLKVISLSLYRCGDMREMENCGCVCMGGCTDMCVQDKQPKAASTFSLPLPSHLLLTLQAPAQLVPSSEQSALTFQAQWVRSPGWAPRQPPVLPPTTTALPTLNESVDLS